MASKLQLKVKLDAAQFANTFAIKALRTGTASGGVLVGVGQVVSMIAKAMGAPAATDKTPSEVEAQEYQEKLLAEEARCKSLYRDKESFDKCLVNYLVMLKQSPMYNGAFDLLDTQDVKMKNFINVRESFVEQMVAYAARSNQVEQEANSALGKAYAQFIEKEKRLKESLGELQEK
jgi:hypothetical protein